MSKRVITIGPLLVVSILVVLGYAAHRFFHDSSPTKLAIPDATKAWTHLHVDRDMWFRNAGLHVSITGEIDGSAEFLAGGDRREIHAGPVHFEFNALEWWSDTAALNYKPINVTSGHLQVVVNIR